jgi:hypothetical protein
VIETANTANTCSANKRLENEFGEQVAEKRVWHWALTSFAAEAWNKTKNEMD